MYLSETEVYKKFYTTVKKVIDNPPVEDPEDIFGADMTTIVSEITGMVKLTEEILKEEKE